MTGWLDGWRRVDNPRSGGGTYDPDGEGYPWRIVLHTIEGRGFPDLSSHQYPPQLWYNPQTRDRAQTIPLDRSGYALYQASDAPYYTNRARALQCELVGFAAEAGDWPDSHLLNIAQDVVVPLVEWVRSQGDDIDLSDPAVPLPGAIPNSATENAPQRLQPVVWAFGPVGMVGHRHVPMGDDHWDAGALNMRRIAAYARELLGGLAPSSTPNPPSKPTSQEDDETMRQYRDVSTGTVYAQFGCFKCQLESDAVRQSWMTMGILAPQDQYFEQSPGVIAELITLNQDTLPLIMAAVSNGYANLNAAINNLINRQQTLSDGIASAVASKVGTGNNLDTTVLADTVRQVVASELAALTLKPAA